MEGRELIGLDDCAYACTNRLLPRLTTDSAISLTSKQAIIDSGCKSERGENGKAGLSGH